MRRVLELNIIKEAEVYTQSQLRTSETRRNKKFLQRQTILNGEKIEKVTQNDRKLSRSQILDKLVNQEVEELL